MSNHAPRLLGRILYASGRHKEASYILANQENVYRQIETKWKDTLSEPMEKVS